MKKIGLFTREDVRLGFSSSKTRKLSIEDAPAEHLWRLGLKAVSGMNPQAKNPNMVASGSKKPDIYILGDAPSKAEDEDGVIGGGRLNGRLKQLLDEDHLYRWNCCVGTYPKDGDPPSRVEIECFRPSVIEDIEATKPQVIVGLGRIPLAWAVGESFTSIDACRGRVFPIRVGSHACWFFPIYHPRDTLSSRDEETLLDVWERDIRSMYKKMKNLPAPEIINITEVSKSIVIFKGDPGDGAKIIADLQEFIDAGKLCSIDYEATCLRPYSGGKLLSVSIGNGKRTIAFPLFHSRAKWSDKEREGVLIALKAFLHSATPKVAQNLKMELEWSCYNFGKSCMYKSTWHDTMLEAYTLNEKRGTHNLNFISAETLGLALKDDGMATLKSDGASDDLMSALKIKAQHARETEIDYAALEQMDLYKLLLYNGLDTAITRMSYYVQKQRLKDEGLWQVYRDQIERVPALVAAQLEGMPINFKVISNLQHEYGTNIAAIEKRISEYPEVRKYSQRFGQFNPSSNTHLISMFKDIIGVQVPKGQKFSVDENALNEIGSPLAADIIALRKANKAKSTYIDPLDPKFERTVVYADGRVHTSFNQTFTDTGRLSSDGPNMQNYPKRNKETKRIRQAFTVPEGHFLLSVDYGQIEARVIGMASRDKNLCEALWTEFDIHQHYAEKFAIAIPKVFKARGSDMKKFRGDIKNQFVFPRFYGAKINSISRSLECKPDEIQDIFDEFDRKFNGVMTWQQNTLRFYARNFYVECLTGRRRHGPLTENMVINSPIQGSASDMVVNAMARLGQKAYEMKMPRLAPVLNIHDDLTFFIPLDKGAEYAHIIVDTMLHTPFKFVNVPITCEMSIGKDWYHMEDVAKFRSDKDVAIPELKFAA